MGTRADNRDGSCREVLTGRHKGKWRVQFTLVADTGIKRRLSRIFRTKTEAKVFLQDLRRGERVEQASREREMTLGEWFHWLIENDWPQSIAPVTIGNRQARFRKHVAKHLGNRPLSRIDPLQVRAFYVCLMEEGLGKPLLQAIRGDLVRAFNQAIRPYQRVPVTIANPFSLPLPRPEPRKAVALAPEEVRQALRCPQLTVSQRAELSLFLLAGLRLGEVMAMTKGQLRFDTDLIVVDRAVQVDFGGKQNVGLPKGGKTRCAVMCWALKSILVEFTCGMAADDLLWPSLVENKPRMKKLVYATWRTIVKAANLPPDMSPHDCRLTHINIIEKLMPSVSVTTLKEHVGHAASGVTEANYSRPLSSSQAILRDCLDHLLG